MYRTGDRVRLLENGEIAFLGRLDQQIKIRGFRIEPAEIVAAIDRFPGVQASARSRAWDAAAAADGEPELVAYVVPAEGCVAARTPSCAAFLASRLPEYMVPAKFVGLDALPLTINGKLDAAALPAPIPSRICCRDSDAPGCAVAPGSVEDQIAEMVRGLLKLPTIDAADNIFLIGGHSMLAMQLVSRIRQVFGVKLALRQVFDRADGRGISPLSLPSGCVRDGDGGRRVMSSTTWPTLAPNRLDHERPLSLYHLLDPEVLANPYPLYRRLRDGGPSALGPVPARVDRHPLRRRRHGLPAVLRRPHPDAGVLRGPRRARGRAHRPDDGPADAVPRRARAHPAAPAGRPGVPARPGRRACARTSRTSQTG